MRGRGDARGVQRIQGRAWRLRFPPRKRCGLPQAVGAITGQSGPSCRQATVGGAPRSDTHWAVISGDSEPANAAWRSVFRASLGMAILEGP